MDKALRNTLRNTVTQCRKLLEEATGALLEGQFGIHGTGTVEDASDMGHLSEEDQRYRGDLLAHLDHIRAAGIKPREAVAQLVREIAFTHLNRLVAFKMMEARGLIREAVSRGIKSQGFLFYLAEHPDDERLWSGGEPERAYRHYLLWLGATFGEEIPALFDPLDPANRAFPPQKVLDQVLELLNGAELVGIWAEDEAIGWVYQYFTPKELRDKARKESRSPRNSYELAFRNQFYTPRYVVEFLGDNTIGRIWYEMTRGETALTDRCRYLVRRAREVFLGHPAIDHHNAAEWVRLALAGDFSVLPERPGFDEIGQFALLIDGYAVAPALGYGDLFEFANKHIAAYEEQGAPLPGDSLELWLILFAHQRGYLRHGYYGTEEDDARLRAIRAVYDGLRAALQNPPEDLTQEELLRQPVFIPHRAPKDPREIKMLDPACGSMHFGLYAFDLFEVIYHEAWERGLFAIKDAGYRAEPAFLHETVRLDPSTDPLSNYSGKSVPFGDAYVVITRRGDAGDGVEADVPYIVASSQRFRVPFDYRVKLSGFDYKAALQSGLIDERAGERFVREVGCFRFAGERPVSREEAFAAFRRQVPRLILEHNIHGIDIDPRACQIAALALWLRAQRAWQEQGLASEDRPKITRAHVVCAEPMPGDKALLEEYLLSVDTRLRPLVRTIWDKMKLAGEAGSLLKIEEEIAEALEAAREEALFEGPPVQMTLYQPNLPPQQMVLDLRASDEERAFWARAEGALLDALHGYARRAANGRALRRRLFAGDAEQGLAFIDLCRQRYDAVLMNPPFGALSRGSKTYVEDAYSRSKGDILAHFVERALALCLSTGRTGAISSRTCFFLGSLTSFREQVLHDDGRLAVMADLGDGVLDAMVETAAYVIAPTSAPDEQGTFFRILIEDDDDKEVVLERLIGGLAQGVRDNRVFSALPDSFLDLRGSPYCYWVSRETRLILAAHPQLEGSVGVVRVGLQTGDDWRFLRLLWEVPLHSLVADGRPGGKWYPYSKTDVAAPWLSPISLAVYWDDDGRTIKSFYDARGKLRSRPQNLDYYFQPGFSYMLRSTRIVPYLVPKGVIPTAGRAQVYPNSGAEFALLGICASNTASAVARFSGEKFAWPKFQASMVQNLPVVDMDDGLVARLIDRIREEVSSRRAIVSGHEPYQEFARPAYLDAVPSGTGEWNLESLLGDELEEAVARAFGLSEEQLLELERDVREAIAIRAPQGGETEDADVDEDISVALALVDESPQANIEGLISYCVGSVIGRWDIRMGLDLALTPALPDSFDPLPVCPPGMLVGPDGLPATPGNIVSEEWLRARPDATTLPPEGSVARPTIPDEEYPLRVNWDGILVDDPDHPDDIVRRVREVLSLLWGERQDAIEGEACEILGVAELRDYLRKPTKGGFWLDHVQRYSKSRRKAPIYWLLQSEKRNYGLWLYYHRLDRDLLFKALVNYVEPKVRLEVARLAELRAERESAGVAGRAAKEVERRIDRQEAFVSELEDFRDKLRRAADLRLAPDLNDGVVLNIAPLWELVSWKVAKQYWDALEAGEYEWSSIGKQLREKGRVKG